jgi:hypothetical protein
MNERINELLKQSRTEYWTQYTPSYDYEKFAELIVRECLKIVEPTEDSGDEWCVTLKGTAQEIKQHFGVEE